MNSIDKKDIVNPVTIVKQYCAENGLLWFFNRNEKIINTYLDKVFKQQGYSLIAIRDNKEEMDNDG